ncbi:MAG: hypothetical protein Q7T11_09410 [Deltaproteobacteria bacterium]|nr:hypothetical protein [Deltaproteobacteria bacterium]
MKKTKKDFEWKPGSSLSKDDYAPLGGVRETGFSKLADGIYADPVKRKEARGKKLARLGKPKSPQVLVEESESGLNQDYTPSEASSRLIRKEDRGIKGILRFNKSPKKKDK